MMDAKDLMMKAYALLELELKGSKIYVRNLETAVAAIQESIDLIKEWSKEVPF